ncbi:TPA: hypothetical protein DEQ22_03340 [Candidatus Nomurabacteria bacterium]|uniref:Uncharacterized protein n=2 Tax=Candidatus Nomuraibacteriota TaxID=1752729 RepID=A0A1F6YPX4_9BACT|nr:MAG: hypothetical protein UV13_C0006G0012 [Parcubacteria group bacterium GW2011_GWC1_42_21]KKS58447.1 MAG: hypothetical protein UV23_C0007G0011 [Candidatus Nomurabacteria bacterium GW2011_GWF1_42_40]KKT08079.1 MAG: hypothetical protein UV85_C0001G0012 [Candidatus Nomurabacteria bacterium GW2011_GWB1_43_19]KKT11464.1 MAG: hypothetical protein UV91_C0005G0012 [Candidatus Nomurabacteria bacterium GW2011_GWF2_43_24]OGJ04698.1 MAG: hypothetical protein A2357_00255 [Candidatus Nomurabacteria bacte
MKKTYFKFFKDGYRKVRGGYSRFLNVYCASCKAHLFLYQKDGPGALKRTYLDRILAPKIKKTKNELVCEKCKKVIGTFFIYKKESRPAVRLYQDSVIKKIGRGIYPPPSYNSKF